MNKKRVHLYKRIFCLISYILHDSFHLVEKVENKAKCKSNVFELSLSNDSDNLFFGVVVLDREINAL